MRLLIKILIFSCIQVIFFLVHIQANAQNGSGKNKIFAEFDTLPLIIKQGEIISKTIKIFNTDPLLQFSFTLNLTFPGEWKALTNLNKVYTVSPLDTIYMPIRIIPQGKIKGNTKYLIFAYIINDMNIPIASAHFMAEKHKIVSWDMNVMPEEKIYLRNGINIADFSINIFNRGNEEIELMLDLSNFRKDKIALMDTNERILKRPVFTFTLQQLADTNFYFRTKYTDGLRNYRLIDTENYNPNSIGEAKKYSIFAKSQQSALTGTGSMFKGRRITLIQLPAEIKINPYGKVSLPILMDMNFSNILSYQPIMSLRLSGRTFLGNGAMLNYFSNTYFSTYFFNPDLYSNSSFNIGYYTTRYNVQLGNVGGGGKGLSGNYRINNNHSVGAYLSRGPRLLKSDFSAFSAFYNFRVWKLNGQVSYSRYAYKRSQFNYDFLSANANYSIVQGHTLGVGGQVFRWVSTNQLNPDTKYGYGLNANYNGNFFKQRIQTNLNGNYVSANGSVIPQGAYWTINHSSIGKLNENLRLQLTNSYLHRDSSIFIKPQTQIDNALNFLPNNRIINISSSLFYNISHYDTIRFHSRGLGVNYSKIDYEANSMIGLNVRGGYNKMVNLPELKSYFFLQTFLIYRYRVWSGNIRYTYGTISSTDLSFLGGSVYPQSVGASVNYQYQFRNPHFVLHNSVTYNYNNRFEKHSIGYTPQFFYYTNSGWRFYITPGYYLRIGKSLQENNESVEKKTTRSHSLILNAGIRKEFGIPLPWIKTKFPSLTFFAFIDHNGNNKQDKGEVPLENVVIRLGEWEVLTNEKGMAQIKNVYMDSTYNFAAFSLIDLKGFFPNIPLTISPFMDSVFYVPFAKGVKINGNVYLDREKIAAGSEKPLDLTGIRITAMNGKAVNTLTDGRGNFSFYVPFGKYTITMDEKVLGDRFTLLQNNFELELDQQTESIFVTFFVVEKRRKVNIKKFDSNGALKETGYVVPANGVKTLGSEEPDVDVPDKPRRNTKGELIEDIDSAAMLRYIDKLFDAVNKEKPVVEPETPVVEPETPVVEPETPVVEPEIVPEKEIETNTPQPVPYEESDSLPEEDTPEISHYDSLPTSQITHDDMKDMLPVSMIIEPGISFRVQLYSVELPRFSPFTFDILNDKVICVEGPTDYWYYTRSFKKYEDAENYAKKVQKMDFSQASVAAFREGVPITLEEAGVK